MTQVADSGDNSGILARFAAMSFETASLQSHVEEAGSHKARWCLARWTAYRNFLLVGIVDC